MGMTTFRALGLMSGTSMDGLDIAACEFEEKGHEWTWKILDGRTVKYPLPLLEALKKAHALTALQLTNLHYGFGKFMAEQCQLFLTQSGFDPMLIASHGHTVFHRPEVGVTLQIGDAQEIANLTGIRTVADFRRQDVELGGQGAPLVPIGDELLFPAFKYCLNLGGIANLSFKFNGKRIAYDCCPFNQVLNFLANQMGKEYDDHGKWSAQGKVDDELLARLNALEYYQRSFPKSLGREWVDASFLPELELSSAKTTDKLATVCEHFALIISGIFEKYGTAPGSRVLITGGGAWHEHFLERLRSKTNVEIKVADPVLLSFKEAMIFAFLGVMRHLERNNVLCSVTGAKEDHCSGVIYNAQ